jgi:putative membrane protein
MERTKAITLVILALFGMIIVLQNTETVETRLLFWSISMPRAVLLLGTSLIGFATGIIVSFFWAGRDMPGERSLPKKDS